MIGIKITKYNHGIIQYHQDGTDIDIAKMLCEIMMKDPRFASMVCGAIPTYLDKLKIDRKGFCDMIMSAKGDR